MIIEYWSVLTVLTFDILVTALYRIVQSDRTAQIVRIVRIVRIARIARIERKLDQTITLSSGFGDSFMSRLMYQ